MISKKIIETPTTLYGFLSGIFISLTTTSIGNFALVPVSPANSVHLKAVAAVAFAASASWFYMGEYVSALARKTKEIEGAVLGYRSAAHAEAVQVVAAEAKLRLYLVLTVAIICSVSWPFL